MDLEKLFSFPSKIKNSAEPSDGIYTENKSIFYHVLPFSLSEENKKLIENEGISINEDFEFSQDEDLKIIENWKSYCEITALPTNCVFHRIGFIIPHRIEPLKHYHAKKSVDENMWPTLCKSMNDRTARQIQRRMSLIFDEFYDGTETLSDENIQKFEKSLFANLEEVLEMSEHLKIPFALLIDKRINLNLRILTQKKKRLIFETVMKHVTISEKNLVEMISKNRTLKFIEEKVDMNIDWKKVSSSSDFVKNEKEAKDSWNSIMYELAVAYDDYSVDYESDEASEVDSKWKMGKYIVLGISFKTCDMFLLIRCLYCSVKDNTSEFLISSFDMEKLRERMERFRCSHLITNNFDSPVTRSIKSRLKVAEKAVFQHLTPLLNLKEKLLMLFEAMTRFNILERVEKKKRGFFELEQIIFTVVYQYYYMRYKWEPPNVLSHFVETMDQSVLAKMKENEEEKVTKKKRSTNGVLSRIRTRVLNDNNEQNKWKRRKIEVEPSVSREESVVFSDATERSKEICDESKRMVTFGQTTRISYSNDEEGHENTENRENTEQEMTNMSISMEESVLAGGGKGWNNSADISGDDFLEFEDNKDGYNSLIIEVPELDKSITEKVVPVIPSEPTDNWLDLVNVFN